MTIHQLFFKTLTRIPQIMMQSTPNSHTMHFSYASNPQDTEIVVPQNENTPSSNISLQLSITFPSENSSLLKTPQELANISSSSKSSSSHITYQHSPPQLLSKDKFTLLMPKAALLAISP